jgi:hypothetical protein
MWGCQVCLGCLLFNRLQKKLQRSGTSFPRTVGGAEGRSDRIEAPFTCRRKKGKNAPLGLISGAETVHLAKPNLMLQSVI